MLLTLSYRPILKQLNEAEDPEILDWFDANKNLPVHYDADEDEDVWEMEAEEIVNVEDGQIEIDEVLKDEVPADAASLSIVKKVSNKFSFHYSNVDSPTAPHNC